MSIDKKMVEKIALLARLHIEEEEKEAFANQLRTILEYVHSLNQLSTDDVEPLTHVLPVNNVFRDDEVKPSLPREKILRDEEYFQVPKVIGDLS